MYVLPGIFRFHTTTSLFLRNVSRALDAFEPTPHQLRAPRCDAHDHWSVHCVELAGRGSSTPPREVTLCDTFLMSELAALIDHVLSNDGDLLERNIFGSGDPTAIANQLEDFLHDVFGAVPHALFYRHSVGVVIGARLGQRDVVVKVHAWNASIERLTAIQRVQREFAGRGIPAPRPLVEPSKLGAGIATVEDFLPGDVANGHDPAILTSLAVELNRFITLGRHVTNVEGLVGPALLSVAPSTLWPTPHSPRFNFEATSDGAAWIDLLAWSARRRLESLEGEPVIGYLDWRVGNLGFDGSTLTAIYDWDSIGLATESFIVGSAAATFSSDWSQPGGSLPSLGEMRAFVSAYEAQRGAHFSEEERHDVDAANLLLVAYGARCQHSDHLLIEGSDASARQGWSGLLRERGDVGLLLG